MLSSAKKVTMKLVKKADTVLKNPKVQKVERAVVRIMPALMLVCACALVFDSTSVLAEGSDPAGTLMTNILKLLGGACTILGVGIAAMGVMHWAAANADGDGPGKQKAMQQIAAAVILFAVSAMLFNSNWLTSLINMPSFEGGVITTPFKF